MAIGSTQGGKEIGLKVTIDPGGMTPAAAAAKELADQLERVSRFASAAEQDMRRMHPAAGAYSQYWHSSPAAAAGIPAVSGVVSHTPTRPDGGASTFNNAAAAYGKFLDGVAKVGVILEVAKGIGDFAEAIAKVGYGTRSARAEMLDLDKSIPVIGETVAKFHMMILTFQDYFEIGSEELGNRARFKRDTLADLPIAAIEMRRQDRTRAINVGEFDMMFGGESRRRASNANIADILGGSLFGGLGAGEDRRISESRRATRRAAAEHEAAVQASMNAEGEMSRSRRIADRTSDRLGRATLRVIDENNRTFSDPLASTSTLDHLITQTMRPAQDNAIALARLEEDIAKAKERGLAAAQAERELNRAKTNEMQTQLAILREQEEKVRGAARQFGALDPNQQQMIRYSAEYVAKNGFDAADPKMRQLLFGFGGTADWIGKLAEKDVGKNEAFQAIMRLTGQRDLETLTNERVQLEQQISVKVELDEQKFQKAMEKVLQDINKMMKDSILKATIAAENKVQIQQAQRAVGWLY